MAFISLTVLKKKHALLEEGTKKEWEIKQLSISIFKILKIQAFQMKFFSYILKNLVWWRDRGSIQTNLKHF